MFHCFIGSVCDRQVRFHAWHLLERYRALVYAWRTGKQGKARQGKEAMFTNGADYEGMIFMLFYRAGRYSSKR